jgi:hypothetical protein
MPTSLEKAAKLADEWNSARKIRLAEQKKVDLMEEAEKALKDDLIHELQMAGASAVGGASCTVELKLKMEPTVMDWTTLRKHIQETGHFDLLYQRINTKAVKERWDLGTEVPGVQKYPTEVLSVHQLK